MSGTGDVIEPDDGILVIGSGGSLALAAARALSIAAAIDVYTNDNILVEVLDAD